MAKKKAAKIAGKEAQKLDQANDGWWRIIMQQQLLANCRRNEIVQRMGTKEEKAVRNGDNPVVGNDGHRIGSQ